MTKRKQIRKQFDRLVRATLITGVAIFMMAAVADASPITYATNSSLTEFVAGVNSLTLNSTSGQAATLTFVANMASISGVPSNIDLGDFLLACPTCTTSQTTHFGAFTFDLIVSDTTDGGAGEFVGISTGGTVSSSSSTIVIYWQAPMSIGPEAVNALTGTFGPTVFDMVSPVSLIVAPNSGTTPGDTTVQAQVSSTPEPATGGLIGLALVGLGLLRKKFFTRK